MILIEVFMLLALSMQTKHIRSTVSNYFLKQNYKTNKNHILLKRTACDPFSSNSAY